MPGILCEHCTAVCCRYIALPIDEPETARDFDDLRWYLLHEGIAAFVEKGNWFLSVQSTCRHLQTDNRCGIYETRPRICRDYSTENCDYHSGDYDWEHHFTCAAHLDDYLKLHPPKARRGSGKRAARNKRRGAPARKRAPRLNNYATAATDSRGVPLPVLRISRGDVAMPLIGATAIGGGPR